MTGTTPTPPAPGHPPTDRRRLLAVLLGLAVLSTAIHYTHNYLMAEMYPPVPFFFPTPTSYRVGIAVFWPVLTALAVWGYLQYVRGRWSRARVALIVYTPLGLTTPGHFLGGMVDIPTFFFVTIFTDFLTCAAVLAFAIWGIPRSTTRDDVDRRATGAAA